MTYYLGIDIGTTKAAAVICDESGRLIDVQSQATDAGIDTAPAHLEQDHNKILSAVDSCIEKLAAKNKEKVVSVGVTGQMHGVILWNDSKVSNLITWQDKRCNQDGFLEKIAGLTGKKLSSGFGSATLAWLVENQVQTLEFEHASTIHDFLVARICGLKRPVTDPTDAASWGLFDIKQEKWETESIQKLNIPENFFPEVMPSGSIAGRITDDFAKCWGLPHKLPVFTAIGDNQASLLATIDEWDKEVSMTLGTGGQVSVVLAPDTDIESQSVSSCEIRPFLNGRYIAVAAPLCGGSAFAWLVKWFKQWCDELSIELPEGLNLYDFFINKALEEEKSPLRIEPNFLGERHSPELRGTIRNISLDNFTPGNVTLALLEGIIRNMKSMIPEEFLAGKEKIIASGNALRQTPLLVAKAEEIFGKPLELIDSREEAACGAAKLCHLKKD